MQQPVDVVEDVFLAYLNILVESAVSGQGRIRDVVPAAVAIDDTVLDFGEQVALGVTLKGFINVKTKALIATVRRQRRHRGSHQS